MASVRPAPLIPVRDNDFSTRAEAAQHCGFSPQMSLHYFRSLTLGKLIEGLEPSYLGYKVLDDENLDEDDGDDRFSIRIANVPKNGYHLKDF